MLYPHSRVLSCFRFRSSIFEVPAVFFLVIWFLVQFLNGIDRLPASSATPISGGVAFWAHVMGFVAGVVLVMFMRRPERSEWSGGAPEVSSSSWISC